MGYEGVTSLFAGAAERDAALRDVEKDSGILARRIDAQHLP